MTRITIATATVIRLCMLVGAVNIRMSAADLRNGVYLDIDFAPEYKLAASYVQRISLSLRVPQPEGMTVPTALQYPNGNAMYMYLLFRPVHAIPMDPTTGETPDPF